MGLTEREQRALDELDRQLSFRDRPLARALTTGRPRRRYRWMWICGAVILAVLAAVLIAEGITRTQAVPAAIGAALLAFDGTGVALVYMFGRRISS